MLVKDIMTQNVIKVSKSTTVEKALEIMLENNIRRLLVEQDGIVTIRDLVYNWKDLKAPVEKVMSRDLLFITPTSPVKEACRVVTSEGVGSLIVGDGARIMGVVTERDLIRHCKVEPNVRVGDVMNVDPVIATPDSDLSEIVEVMQSYWKRHAVIIDGKKPIGVISAKDIGRALLAKKTLKGIRAYDFMTISIYKVTPDSSAETARLLMAEKNIGFLPVVDPVTLLGSISERELLAVMSI
ncbi:CBS domain-containing protein [Stygiolobus caldivivus]|uniref:Histidine kinase n=1 Tax=Stygiolobus caldivivus TaxID=2824673 RepID=A0A8D5ZHY7_9CREN|nr:CBS domain-containing protein [Stygiolobus caldivivus]BCU69136.1 histidine kinase [Stygiolobus caldivivus]